MKASARARTRLRFRMRARFLNRFHLETIVSVRTLSSSLVDVDQEQGNQLQRLRQAPPLKVKGHRARLLQLSPVVARLHRLQNNLLLFRLGLRRLALRPTPALFLRKDLQLYLRQWILHPLESQWMFLQQVHLVDRRFLLVRHLLEVQRFLLATIPLEHLLSSRLLPPLGVKIGRTANLLS